MIEISWLIGSVLTRQGRLAPDNAHRSIICANSTGLAIIKTTICFCKGYKGRCRFIELSSE